MKRQGFTVIELLVIVALLIGTGVVLFFQLSSLSAQQTDKQKKVAINAIYYSLEEGFYPKNGYYPEHITDDTLPTMDAELLTDPAGVKLGDAGSAYRYEPTDCNDGKCTGYTLRATLDKEADFVKENRAKS